MSEDKPPVGRQADLAPSGFGMRYMSGEPISIVPGRGVAMGSSASVLREGFRAEQARPDLGG